MSVFHSDSFMVLTATVFADKTKVRSSYFKRCNWKNL